MPKLSVIIPSYNCQYVSRTVDDIFSKAKEEIEVIVLLDNYWPTPLINDHKNLIIVHKGKQTGMRDSINLGVEIATGKYIAKCDDHCLFGEGFDVALKKESQENWLQVPSKYSLDAKTWTIVRQAVEYEFMAFPYSSKSGIGLYSKKWLGKNGINPPNRRVSEWYYKENERINIKIDDIMIIQGSFWFMEKQHFINIGGLFNYKTMYQEPQELTFKTWLSGGKVVVNKNTWYAHMYKGDDFGDEPHIRGYELNLNAMRKTERYGNWFWMNDKWELATRKMKWLIDKFSPIPSWPEDWEFQRDEYYKKYPMDYNDNE